MGQGCDCNHCPGCGDAPEEPKKKAGAVPAETEDVDADADAEIDLGDDVDDDFEDEEE